MANASNNWTGSGRLGQDPEVKAVGQSHVLNINIATESDQKIDGSWQKVTIWVPLTIWGQTAEFIGRNLVKGNEVNVCGEIRTKEWTDNDGGKRYGWFVHVEDIKPVGSWGKNSTPAGASNQSAPAPSQAVAQGSLVGDQDEPF